MPNNDVDPVEEELDTEDYVLEEDDAEEANEPAKEKPRVGGYRVLSLFAFLIGLAGLFLGALSKWMPALAPVFLPEGKVMNGSLLGGILEFFHRLRIPTLFQGGFANSMLQITNLTVVLFLCASILASLVCFLISIFSAKHAERASVVSVVVLFLSYFGAFAWTFLLTGTLSGVFIKEIVDLPTGIISCALFLLLAIETLARRKAVGLANLAMLLLVFASVYGVSYPGSLNGQNAFNALVFKGRVFLALASLLMVCALCFNLIAATSRLGVKKPTVFDCVRYGVLVFTVLLYFIAGLSTSGVKGAIFSGSSQLVPAILLLTASIAALVFTIVLAVALPKEQTEEQAEEESEEEPEVEQVKETVEPEEEEEEPVEEAPSEPEEPEEEIAEEPVPVKEEAPISEFERTMTALANGETPPPPAQPVSAPAPEPAPAPAPEPAPAPMFPPSAYAPYPHPQPQPQPRPSYFEVSSQYTYDPFINTLTVQEKNEFGDIFIAGKYGDLNYLPRYVIGGNNDEFFHTVFIYLGKFRKNISSELLEKMYLYISKL